MVGESNLYGMRKKLSMKPTFGPNTLEPTVVVGALLFISNAIEPKPLFGHVRVMRRFLSLHDGCFNTGASSFTGFLEICLQGKVCNN